MRLDQGRNAAKVLGGHEQQQQAKNRASVTHLSSSSIADKDELKGRDVRRFSHSADVSVGVCKVM
jgi:hypothetical protein